MSHSLRDAQASGRLEYHPPTLEQWGTVGGITRAGNTSGSGDVCYQPNTGQEQFTHENGSIENSHCELL